jgi:thiol:disulfide interchange protein
VLGRIRKFVEPEDALKVIGGAVKKLQQQRTASGAATPRLPWIKDDEKVAFDRARTEGKGVLVDFTAEWCTPCEELETTFAHDDVYKAITTSFVPLKLDVTNATDMNNERKQRYNAETLPAVVLMSADGKVLGRVSKFVEPEDMMKIIVPASEALAAQTAAARP